MSEVILSDYFYGDESEQFIYFRIPRLLITSPRFKHLSTDAKLLYGMLLDRMSLSAKNNWYDEDGRVYIYYTVEEICGDMNCGRDKAMKLLAELDTGKGVGLIERIKQGQGMVLTADTGTEFPEMYRHWDRVEQYLYRERGLHLTILRHPKGFEWLMFDEPKEKPSSIELRAQLGVPPYLYVNP